MMRPVDVKPREGEVRGTRFEEYVLHEPLPDLDFTLTPEVIREYALAVDADIAIAGEHGPVALPSVLCVYLMAVLYRKYPPAQGGIMAGNEFEFHQEIPADAETRVVANGRIEAMFEKRGREYIQYSVEFRTKADGALLATALNTSTFPSEESARQE